jgi:hypothetical protein
MLLSVSYKSLTIAIDVARAEELYARLNQAGQVEDEEHEGEDEHEARQ